MAKLRFLLIAVLGLIFTPSAARAWGEYGHLTVCEVAYRNLTSTARDQLKIILQSESGGTVVRAREGVERRRYTSFNVGCLEEDERPRRHPKDHFLNVARDLLAIQNDSCPISGSSGNQLACIFSGLQRDLAILRDRDRSNEDRAFALMAIGHWIGDLHQPLHVSFADDVGGNNIPVRLQGGCGSSRYRVQDMHGLWDNCLLEAGLFERIRRRPDFRTTWSRRTIAYRAADTLMANTSLAEERGYSAGEPWQWAAESYAVSRSALTDYCRLEGSVCQPVRFEGSSRRLSQDYLDANNDIAEERLTRAGFRLAHILNRALDPAYRGPVADGLQLQ